MRLIEEPKHGDRFDVTDSAYPTMFEVLGQSSEIHYPHSTTYGYVIRGSAHVEVPIIGRDIGGPAIAADLSEGGFFCIPQQFSIEVHKSRLSLVALITRIGFKGMSHFGMIEEVGRLSYIDGCSDTLLVPPPRLGDPCFNFLHFPRGILQTQHTHPTIRAGIVARGRGHAFRLPAAGSSGWAKELAPGCVFVLEPQEIHSFRTDESDETMDVIAYHPDTDWGPTDAVHPMRNRTYIGNDRGPTSVSS